MSPVSSEMAIVDFVENRSRVIYGQLYIPGRDRDAFIKRFADDVIAAVNAAYLEEAAAALPQGVPPEDLTVRRIRNVITMKVQEQEAPFKRE